jgi:AbrB family looped-hinge helix DNA binding protein
MANISITKMSSKGQIVIPLEIREDFNIGDKIIIFRSGKQIIMKKADDFDENLKDDILFAKKTEEAFKKYEKGEFREVDSKEFLKLLDKWSK